MTALSRAVAGLAIFATLAVVAVWWVADEIGRDRAPRADEPLLVFDPETVAQIEINNPSGRFSIERWARGGWRLRAPVATGADSSAIRALLDGLADLRIAGWLGEVENETLYDLSPPRFSVTLTEDSGEQHSLVAGSVNSFSGLIYVRLSGSGPVLLTAGSLRYQLARDLLQLREKRLVVFVPEELARVEVELSDGRRYTLERRGEEFWLTAPFVARADPLSVGEIIAALGNIRASRFLSETPPRRELESHGFDKPTIRVALRWTTDREPVEVLFIRAEHSGGPLACRRDPSPIVELASSWVFRQLERDADDLRDRRLLHFERDEVASLILRQPPAAARLTKRREQGGWRWYLADGEATEREAKDSEVFALLYKLWSLRADEILPGPATEPDSAANGLGLAAPGVELLDAAGAQLGGIRFGDLSGRSRWVAISTPGSGNSLDRLALVAVDKIDAIGLAAAYYLDPGPAGSGGGASED